LESFKFIFWWEWTHRFIGRAVGLVFFVPFAWFLFTRRIDRGLARKLLGFFVLGGLQGALGWYMVKSGLVDDPRVSQYRLAAHLGLAFLIFGLMLWTGLGLYHRRVKAEATSALRSVQKSGVAIATLLFVMVLSGAFVAGTHAGALYNSFPRMGEHWIPPEILAMTPGWINVFENQSTIQFDHRAIAWTLFFAIPLWCRSALNYAPQARLAAWGVLVALTLQLSLGIATLLNGVPTALAAAHQAGAMILFATVIGLNHALRRKVD
jgi:heme a synthase